MIPADASTSPALAASMSLLVPGLGQVYLGQWWRGGGLFLGSATVCFGLGLCNLAVAYDAWSLAHTLRERPISVAHSSRSLMALTVAWRAARWLFEKVIDRIPSVNVLYRMFVKGEKIGG